MRPKRPSASGKSSKRTVPVDCSAKFEKLLKQGSVLNHYSLRLYVTGNTPRSAAAIANIRGLCEEYLKGRYHLEVVDIYQRPGEAQNEQIIAAPTLIKQSPNPPKRVVGNLSDREKVIVLLDLENNPN